MHKIVNGKSIPLTQEEIDAKLADEAEYEQIKAETLWASQRKEAYGSIEDQLDYIVHNGIAAFIQRNKDIKAQYPKPE